MTPHRLRNVAGLAAAIVPLAIVVHVAAEASAIGLAGLDSGFLLRHGYLALVFGASAAWFGSTVGLGRVAAERRRRCALVRADLAGARHAGNLVLLLLANLGFFGVTQAIEGNPIAAGSVLCGLAVALAGSLLAALLVFFFGRSLAVAGLTSAIATSPPHPLAVMVAQRERNIDVALHATTLYRLFIPNRPPPFASQP